MVHIKRNLWKVETWPLNWDDDGDARSRSVPRVTELTLNPVCLTFTASVVQWHMVSFPIFCQTQEECDQVPGWVAVCPGLWLSPVGRVRPEASAAVASLLSQPFLLCSDLIFRSTVSSGSRSSLVPTRVSPPAAVPPCEVYPQNKLTSGKMGVQEIRVPVFT